MDIVRELKAAKGLYVDCPNCQEPIPLSRATVFDATKKLPPEAAAALEASRAGLRAELDEVKRERLGLTSRTFKGAATGRIGKRLEMIGASLPGLPVAGRDCRALSDPIDYLAFEGASQGEVRAVRFIEVKSENARLSELQRAIKAAVDRGSVSLVVADHRLCLK
jgi:predicted Holliday junction resolvase-like endonuclease